MLFVFLDVWKSWGRCFSWQQINQSESSESHSPNRWKKVVAAVFLEGVRWRHKLLNTRGPSVSLRALVTKLSSETLVKQMYATRQANACDIRSRCIPHCNWMNATLPNYTYHNANSWFQHCKRQAILRTLVSILQHFIQMVLQELLRQVNVGSRYLWRFCEFHDL